MSIERHEVSGGKRLGFAVFLALFVLVSLEGLCRLAEAWIEHRHARAAQYENQFIRVRGLVDVFEQREIDGEEWYVRTKHHWIPEWPRFPVKKGADTFRVFCLGGSAAMGWPHSGEYAYPALLARKLERLFPDKTFEVINVAGNTYASYRVKIVFDEIIDYEPDLILIYSGNNEFLENVVYNTDSPVADGDTELAAPWSHSAIVRLAHMAVARNASEKRVVDVGSYGRRDRTATRLSFAFGRASALRRDPEQFGIVARHYRYNIESMLKVASERRVPVILLNVPVNLADWQPNVSEHREDLSASQLALWQESFRAGVLALEAGEPARAAEALERAAAIDDLHAETWFHLGTALRDLGRSEAAKRAFERAVETDAFPFRSLFNDDLREIAAAQGVPLVDVVARLNAASSDGILGLDLLVDYVHPTIIANELIAQAVVEEMAERELLPGRPAMPPAAARLEIPSDAEENVTVLRGLFSQFLVMRQYSHLDALGARLERAVRAELPGADAKERVVLEQLLADLESWLQVIRPYRRLLHAEKLGILEEEFSPEQAEATFQAYVDLMRQLEGRRVSDAEFATFVPERHYR